MKIQLKQVKKILQILIFYFLENTATTVRLSSTNKNLNQSPPKFQYYPPELRINQLAKSSNSKRSSDLNGDKKVVLKYTNNNSNNNSKLNNNNNNNEEEHSQHGNNESYQQNIEQHSQIDNNNNENNESYQQQENEA